MYDVSILYIYVYVMCILMMNVTKENNLIKKLGKKFRNSILNYSPLVLRKWAKNQSEFFDLNPSSLKNNGRREFFCGPQLSSIY